MNNIQEQEEMDYHPDTDERNAFAHSRMERQLRDHMIDEVLGRGHHAVVVCGVARCRQTDATIGETRVLVSEHMTLQEANSAADRIADDVGEHDEMGFQVESPKGGSI
jgi:nicotinamidase-related amidase